MLTQRAALLGFVGFCFYLIAIVNALPPYFYALTWLVVGMLVSSAGLALLSLNAVRCRWKVANPRGAQGQHGPLVEFSFSNGGSLNKTGILIEFRLRSRRKNELLIRRALLEALPSGVAIETAIPIPNLPRGRYELEGIRLVGSDVLGLFRRTRRMASQSETPLPELICGPALVALAEHAAFLHPAAGQLAGAIESRDRIGQGEDLRGTRPYVPGDDLRHVHWKSTARTGQFVVKETHQASRNRPLILWDGAAQTTWGIEGETTTEWSLRLAASLARLMARDGASCELARLDGEPILVAPREDCAWGLMVDALADATAERKTALEAALQSVLSTGYELSDIYLISASLSPELPRLAARWSARGRRVRVALFDGAAFEAIRNGSRRALVREQHIGDQKLAISAENFQKQRETLQNAGALTILVAPPDENGRDCSTALRLAAHGLLKR